MMEHNENFASAQGQTKTHLRAISFGNSLSLAKTQSLQHQNTKNPKSEIENFEGLIEGTQADEKVENTQPNMFDKLANSVIED